MARVPIGEVEFVFPTVIPPEIRFLKLPAEIRQLVYDHLFQGTGFHFRRTDDGFRLAIKAPGRHVLSLPLTCKTIYAEARIRLVHSIRLDLSKPGGRTAPTDGLSLAMGRALSDFTLNNVRYAAGMPLSKSTGLEPNPDFGILIRRLPAVRVCVSPPVDVEVSKTLLDRWVTKGPEALFKKLCSFGSQDFLDKCGVERIYGPQCIMRLMVKTPEFSSTFYSMVGLAAIAFAWGL